MATRARASRLACDGPKWLVSLVETLAGPNFSLLIRYVGQQQSHIAEFLLCQKTVTCLQDWKPCQQSHKALKLITHQETTLLDWWKIERKSESDYNSSWREHGFLYKLKYLCLEKVADWQNDTAGATSWAALEKHILAWGWRQKESFMVRLKVFKNLFFINSKYLWTKNR